MCISDTTRYPRLRKFALGESKLLSSLAGFEPSSLEIKKSLADCSTSD